MLAMGRTLRGIVEGQSIPDVFLPRLIELWRQGRFPVDRLMTYYSFEDIDRAARDAEEGSSSSRCCEWRHNAASGRPPRMQAFCRICCKGRIWRRAGGAAC